MIEESQEKVYLCLRIRKHMDLLVIANNQVYYLDKNKCY